MSMSSTSNAERRPSECATDFIISNSIMKLMFVNGFLANIAQSLRKVPTRDIPTAGVCFDRSEDEFIMYWNPDFFSSLTIEEVQGVVMHEIYHIVFQHLSQRRAPANIDGIAKDLAINSIIVSSANDKDTKLPACALVPGVSGPSSADRGSAKLSDLIARLPKLKTTQQYYQTIVDELGTTLVPVEFGQFDHHFDHDDDNEYTLIKTNELLARAVRESDANQMWGNTPIHVQRAVRNHLNRSVSWRAVLERFVGYNTKGRSRPSVKKINNRYPYIHPGRTIARRARMLIAIDQSGSVDDGMLSMFFDALRSLTQNVSIDVLPFDCTASSTEIFEWKKGANPALARTRSGGTNFSAPTGIANDPLHRGRWDAMLILTDGAAPAPEPCTIARGWVLPKEMKLMFSTSETLIELSENEAALSQL